MNILRYIKLKHFCGELDNLTDQEELLIKLLDNLYQDELGFLRNKKGDDVWIAHYNSNSHCLHINDKKFYQVFKKYFNVNEHDFIILFNNFFQVRLNDTQKIEIFIIC